MHEGGREMTGINPPRCSDCGGSGECRECSGTGVNVHLNEAEPKCRNCNGTGVCPTCQGARISLKLFD